MVPILITAIHVAEARKDLGRQLAQWRKAAGLTQVRLAPRLGYSRSALANAEIGREHAPRSFWQAADRELCADGALLAGYEQFATLEARHKAQIAQIRDQERAGRIAVLMSPADCNPGTISSGHDLKAAESNTDERPSPDATVWGRGGEGSTIATSLHALPGVIQPPSQISDISVAQDAEPHAGDTVTLAVVSDGQARSFRVSRRALLELATGLATLPAVSAARVPVRRTIDPEIVEHFTALRALLVQADDKLGSLNILSTVEQQLALIATLRRQARGELRTQLLATEARWNEFSGWLSDDIGDREAGSQSLDRAASMAQEANDQEFCAYVLARKAQRMIGTGDEDRVVGLARAAARTPNVPVLVHSFAAVQEAHGSAIDGDLSAFRAAIDQARGLIENAPPGGHDDALGSFCTTPYLSAQEGEGWLRLNNPRKAIASFTTAVNQWPERYRRERGMYLSRTAHAYLAASEPDRAAATAADALALATTTGSARIRGDVVALASQLKPFSGQPAVRHFLEQVASTA